MFCRLFSLHYGSQFFSVCIEIIFLSGTSRRHPYFAAHLQLHCSWLCTHNCQVCARASIGQHMLPYGRLRLFPT